MTNPHSQTRICHYNGLKHSCAMDILHFKCIDPFSRKAISYSVEIHFKLFKMESWRMTQMGKKTMKHKARKKCIGTVSIEIHCFKTFAILACRIGRPTLTVIVNITTS